MSGFFLSGWRKLLAPEQTLQLTFQLYSSVALHVLSAVTCDLTFFYSIHLLLFQPNVRVLSLLSRQLMGHFTRAHLFLFNWHLNSFQCRHSRWHFKPFTVSELYLSRTSWLKLNFPSLLTPTTFRFSRQFTLTAFTSYSSADTSTDVVFQVHTFALAQIYFRTVGSIHFQHILTAHSVFLDMYNLSSTSTTTSTYYFPVLQWSSLVLARVKYLES